MTVLLLTKLWINRVDTGEAVTGYSDPDRPQTFTTDLHVRAYASGRRRSVTAAGENGEIPFRLVDIDLATVVTLRSWKGVTVQVRDHRGQKWFGAFADVDVDEYTDPSRYAARFTLRLLTFAEGV